jgi:hypothetical protein
MPTFKSPRPTLPPDTALASALPELRAAELKLRKNASQHGITYVIAEFGGIRSLSDTTKAMDYRAAEYPGYVKAMRAINKAPLSINEWRPIAPYGNSYHNYGAAFDVFVTSVPEGRSQSWGLQLLQIAGPAVGLRNGASFNDPPHFELPLKLSDVRAMWAKHTGGTGQPKPSGSTTVGVLAGVGVVALLVFLALSRKSP